MKKILTAVCIAALTCTTVVAVDYDAATKKAFYDQLQVEMMKAMKDSLIQQGFEEQNVAQYINALERKIDRQQLESQTWGCVTKYKPEEITTHTEQIAKECFVGWSTDLIAKNSALLELLK